MKQLILDVSATASGQCMPHGIEWGADTEIINDNSQATFPGSSRVTSMGTLETTFFVDKNIVPIQIENIPCIYTLLNLLFVIWW